jgi:Zn finger protein HypA/HybF involved in hydrogenase expression
MSELQSTTTSLFNKILLQTQLSNTAVKRIHIALGEMFELGQEKIENQWRDLSKDTPLEHAEICFRLITAEVQCMACFKKYHPSDGSIHCPHCGSFGAKILSGEEFHVETIEMDN